MTGRPLCAELTVVRPTMVHCPVPAAPLRPSSCRGHRHSAREWSAYWRSSTRLVLLAANDAMRHRPKTMRSGIACSRVRRPSTQSPHQARGVAASKVATTCQLLTRPDKYVTSCQRGQCVAAERTRRALPSPAVSPVGKKGAARQRCPGRRYKRTRCTNFGSTPAHPVCARKLR